MIYESRPDAGPQIAALAIRSGNAVLLKGGREAANTNAAIGEMIRGALDKYGVRDAVQLVSTREEIAELLKMDDLINLVIPRGSNEMVRSIQQSTKIPVLGPCGRRMPCLHRRVRRSGKSGAHRRRFESPISSGLQRGRDAAGSFEFAGREKVLQALAMPGSNCAIRASGRSISILIMNVKVVNSLDEAIDHIHQVRLRAHRRDRYGKRRERPPFSERSRFRRSLLERLDAFRRWFPLRLRRRSRRQHQQNSRARACGRRGTADLQVPAIGNGHIVATYTGEREALPP